MSCREAGSQELLELETLKRRDVQQLREGAALQKRERHREPSEAGNQPAEFCLHKTKPDWNTKSCHRDDLLIQQVGNHRDGVLVGLLFHYDLILKTLDKGMHCFSSFSLLPSSLPECQKNEV